MSNYNTSLQSNNTDLQSILDTINALPEAGGSGGASVETCTVNLSYTGFMSFFIIDYLSENLDVQGGSFGGMVGSTGIKSANVVKNSIVLIENAFEVSVSGNATLLGRLDDEFARVAVRITGDAELTCS